MIVALYTQKNGHPLGLGSSMAGVSLQSSEGCGFDHRLGLRNRFSECKA